jgi:hypothetical protein
MPGKDVTLSVHKMSWNSRSKLNFAQCFKQIDTHTKLECTLKKKSKLLNYTQRVSGGMVDDASVLL